MKFYIAGRFTQKEAVRALQQKLIALGHAITYDWTTHKDMRPFADNKEIAIQYATNDIKGVVDCDVLIVLCDNAQGGVGMHTEIGVGAACQMLTGKPQVYVVGEDCEEMLFYFHPTVKRRRKIEEVLDEITNILAS